MILTVFLTLSLSIIFVLYIYFVYIESFKLWKNLHVAGPKPSPFFGTIKDFIFLKVSLGLYVKQVYLDYPTQPFVGVYLRTKPTLILRDLDLIRDVLIKDFPIFAGRGIKVNTKIEPMFQHMFFLEPDKWQPLRRELSPAFTSGKLKMMFQTIVECAKDLDQFVEKSVQNNQPIDVHDLMARYTMETIGQCLLGLKLNTLSADQQNNEFHRIGTKVFILDKISIIRFWTRNFLPKIYDFFERAFYDKETTEFFLKIYKQMDEVRERNNINTNDFLDKLRGVKKLQDQFQQMEITDSFLAAQVFVFFTAGYATPTTMMSAALYELARHPDIQEKLREEIRKWLECNGGVFQYGNIGQLKYLHKVFQETLRKYPPSFLLRRKSHSPYKFAGTNLTIPEGQDIIIPLHGIHHDPNLYPNPDVFDPERFDEEVMKCRHPMSFLPFGDGPRHCIGLRFATYQTKVGLIYMVNQYKMDTCEKTIIPYNPDPTGSLLMPKDGLFLKLTKIC